MPARPKAVKNCSDAVRSVISIVTEYVQQELGKSSNASGSDSESRKPRSVGRGAQS